MSRKQLTSLQTHPWMCEDMACVIAGDFRGLVGTVKELSIGKRLQTVLTIELQNGRRIEVDGEDVIPV